MPDPDRILTLKALAAETGLPASAIYAVCVPRGDLAIVRMPTRRANAKHPASGRIYIRRADWDDYVLRHRQVKNDAPERAVQRAALAQLPGWDRYSKKP